MITNVNSTNVSNENNFDVNSSNNTQLLVVETKAVALIQPMGLVVQDKLQAVGELLANYESNDLALIRNVQVIANSIVSLTDNPVAQRAILERYLNTARTTAKIIQKTEERKQITAIVSLQKEQMELALPGKIEEFNQSIVLHKSALEQSFQSTIFHQQATIEVLENRIEDNDNETISKEQKRVQCEQKITKLKEEVEALKYEKSTLHL
ncbi:MAG: hypothetical protein H0W50_06410 [Parachlamydiaceae bacterium]|nr:hypothetical protein [Parachlamydiaceae bacterium]